MTSPRALHQSDSNRVTDTRIRSGSHDDIPAIARLIHRANAGHGIPHIGEQELEAVAEQGQLIVLQLVPGEVAAAACIATGRGLVFLVIDPRVASSQLEHRMIGVADALYDSEPCRGVRSAPGAR